MNSQTPDSAAVRGSGIIDWAVAEAAFPNERESGDRFVVQPCTHGILIGAVDGMGHGTEAAAAAKIAKATLEAHAFESPVALMLRCHDALKGTRGAVMTIAFLHRRDRTLTWLGVGNVEAVLIHEGGKVAARPDWALLRNGVIGYRLPPLRAEQLLLKPMDTLIFVTDGIAPDFEKGISLSDDPQRIADGILARHRPGHDDALVLVARYLGGEA